MFDLDLLAENVLDHYRNPRNKRVVENAFVSTGASNPSCGDSISFQLKLSDGRISEVGFSGSGCVISQASASMLSEKISGMALGGVLGLSSRDVLELLGVEVSGSRLGCALLSLRVLQKGVSEKLGVRPPELEGTDFW